MYLYDYGNSRENYCPLHQDRWWRLISPSGLRACYRSSRVLREINKAIDDLPDSEEREERAILNLINMLYNITKHLEYYKNAKKKASADITKVNKTISVIEHTLTALRSVY